MIDLRNYQLNGVEDLRNAIRQGHRRILYRLPCGGGKTVMMAFMAKNATLKNKRTMFTVHRKELLIQASRTLDKFGISHGLIAPGHGMTGDLVQVASIDTLRNRLEKVTPPDMLILDECHHSMAASWQRVIEHYNKSITIGLSATPARLSGESLGDIFETMVFGPSEKELISMGYLSNYLVYAPPVGIDLSDVGTARGDYIIGDLEKATDKPVITGNSVQHYSRLCGGKRGIVYCVSIKHATNVCEEFRNHGINAMSIDSKMSQGQRDYAVKSFSHGSIQILVNVDIISEGFDCPSIECVSLLRPTQSLPLYRQQSGRALRIMEGKSVAVILDHVGNCMRHGLPDEEIEWSLDGEKKRKRKKNEDEPKVRQCEKCYAVFPLTVMICPQCGALVEIKKRDPLKQVQGDLVQMDSEQVAILRKNMRQEQGLAQSLEDLIRIGKSRGYHPGWAQRVYNARMDKQRKQYSLEVA